MVPERSLWEKIIGRTPLGQTARELYAAADTADRLHGHLAQLPAGWMAVSGFPVGTGDVTVEHVLVGPAGVFTVGTAAERDQRRPDEFARTRAETTRLRTQWARGLDHDVPVQSIVVHDRTPATPTSDTGAIAIIESELIPTLTELPAVLDDGHTQRLAAMVAAVSTPARIEHSDAFTRLRRDVISARRVRRGWLIGAVSAAVAAAAGAAITLL